MHARNLGVVFGRKWIGFVVERELMIRNSDAHALK